MRGSRVKALRTTECPNPGRKNGGRDKANVKREGYRWFDPASFGRSLRRKKVTRGRA